MSLDAALRRPMDYHKLPESTRWRIDDGLGILDWAPTPDETLEYLRRRALIEDPYAMREYPRAWASTRLDSIEKYPEMWAPTLVALESVYVTFLEALYMWDSNGRDLVRQALARMSTKYFQIGNLTLDTGLLPMDFNGLVIRLKELREEVRVNHRRWLTKTQSFNEGTR